MILKRLYERTESDDKKLTAIGNGSETLKNVAIQRLGLNKFYILSRNNIYPKKRGSGRKDFYFLERTDFHKFNALGAIEKLNENKSEKWQLTNIAKATHYWSGDSFFAMPKTGVYATPGRMFARMEVSEQSRLEEQRLATTTSTLNTVESGLSKPRFRTQSEGTLR